MSNVSITYILSMLPMLIEMKSLFQDRPFNYPNNQSQFPPGNRRLSPQTFQLVNPPCSRLVCPCVSLHLFQQCNHLCSHYRCQRDNPPHSPPGNPLANRLLSPVGNHRVNLRRCQLGSPMVNRPPSRLRSRVFSHCPSHQVDHLTPHQYSRRSNRHRGNY